MKTTLLKKVRKNFEIIEFNDSEQITTDFLKEMQNIFGLPFYLSRHKYDAAGSDVDFVKTLIEAKTALIQIVKRNYAYLK